jgi:hypothetical protein
MTAIQDGKAVEKTGDKNQQTRAADAVRDTLRRMRE